ncbi:hypothetical protein [Candidiatus Paracoxiella cheracis]
MEIFEVAVTKQAEKQLRTLPAYIVLKLHKRVAMLVIDYCHPCQ